MVHNYYLGNGLWQVIIKLGPKWVFTGEALTEFRLAINKKLSLDHIGVVWYNLTRLEKCDFFRFTSLPFQLIAFMEVGP